MATPSRLFSRFSRRIAAAGRPIAGAPGGILAPRLPQVPFPGAYRPVQTEVAHYQAAKYGQQPFIVNPTLQRFGYSSTATSQPASQKPLLEGSIQKMAVDSPKEISKMPTTSYTGISKFPPYYLLFGWIEEIILDYVHHEVTRSMVLVYLRVFLLIVMKDVFLNCYDLFV